MVVKKNIPSRQNKLSKKSKSKNKTDPNQLNLFSVSEKKASSRKRTSSVIKKTFLRRKNIVANYKNYATQINSILQKNKVYENQIKKNKTFFTKKYIKNILKYNFKSFKNFKQTKIYNDFLAMTETKIRNLSRLIEKEKANNLNKNHTFILFLKKIETDHKKLIKDINKFIEDVKYINIADDLILSHRISGDKELAQAIPEQVSLIEKKLPSMQEKLAKDYSKVISFSDLILREQNYNYAKDLANKEYRS